MRVLLVHGLGRTPLSLMFLGLRLARAGHAPEYFGYSATLEHRDRIVERLVRRLEDLEETGAEVGLIGHSFGGLLLRQAAARVPGLRVRHFVMLGTPNHPPRLAPRAWRWLPYRLLRGSCGEALTREDWFAQLPPLAVPHTVVAGTAGWGPRGPFGGEQNDGVVAVAEAAVSAGDPPVLLPVFHTFMMNSGAVERVIRERLAC